jgi:hypothetical protein
MVMLHLGTAAGFPKKRTHVQKRMLALTLSRTGAAISHGSVMGGRII